MQKCRYNDKFIYAFNVMGENDTIINETEKEWRKAAEENLLTCEECGHPVILRIKDPSKKRPHFSHKVINGFIHECQYSRESEEHIEGKKILLKYIESLYDDVYSEVRYKFSKQCISDLYFRFSDDQKLVIEFQRLNTRIDTWEKKHLFYKEQGINDIWIFSGKGEELQDLQREYELNYYKRIILNELQDKILFLDVNKKDLTLVSKIICKDERNGKIIYDKIFSRSYPLDQVRILKNGEVQSPFDNEYLVEKERVLGEYRKLIEKDKEDKNNQNYSTNILTQIKTKHIHINNSKTSQIQNNSNTGKPSISQSEKAGLKGFYKEIYEYEIKKAIEARQIDRLNPIIEKCCRDTKTLDTVKGILDNYLKAGYSYAEIILGIINKSIT